MSLPWSSNLQIDRQTHLQMCKAYESAAKEMSFRNTGINQSEYEALTVWKIGCNSRNRPWHPFLEIHTRPFPISHPAAIDHLKASMRVVKVWSVRHIFLSLRPSLDCVPAKSTLFMTQ